MDATALCDRFFEILIAGDRPAARLVVSEARKNGYTPRDIVTELFWPVYQKVDTLFRSDALPCLAHHMAVRLLRVLVDQNASMLTSEAPSALPQGPFTEPRTVFVVCGHSEAEELGAQMAVDLLEGCGFEVTFGGSKIASDEIIARVNEHQPDILLLFSSSAEDLPQIRALIDTLRQIGACPALQIAVGAGVFARAEGLAEEIGADIWAAEPLDMVDRLLEQPSRRASAEQRSVGKSRRRRNAA